MKTEKQWELFVSSDTEIKAYFNALLGVHSNGYIDYKLFRRTIKKQHLDAPYTRNIKQGTDVRLGASIVTGLFTLFAVGSIASNPGLHTFIPALIALGGFKITKYAHQYTKSQINEGTEKKLEKTVLKYARNHARATKQDRTSQPQAFSHHTF